MEANKRLVLYHRQTLERAEAEKPPAYDVVPVDDPFPEWGIRSLDSEKDASPDPDEFLLGASSVFRQRPHFRSRFEDLSIDRLLLDDPQQDLDDFHA